MKWIVALLLAACAAFAAAADAADCSGTPITALPPHHVGAFSWGPVIRPMGDACIRFIAVEPSNDLEWWAGGDNGVYVTKDGGKTWTQALSGNVSAMLLTHYDKLQLVYAAVGKDLYMTRTHGPKLGHAATLDDTVTSLLVIGGTLYAGLGASASAKPSGVVVANLGAGYPQFHSFGAGQTGLIVWTLTRVPGGALFAGTEVIDHSKPAPFFRSNDDAKVWVNVGGALPWHAAAAAARDDGRLFVLTEGAGLFVTADNGKTWSALATNPVPSVSLLIDAKDPARIFGGRQAVKGSSGGGIFVSGNSGKTFYPIGLPGLTVGSLSMNGAGTKIYATAYASGIYVSPVP